MVLIEHTSGSTVFYNGHWQYANSPNIVELGTGWTSIAANAFKSTPITSIDIPASVTVIGPSAFEQAASLTTVTFASSGSELGYISQNAFESTGLTSIDIPASVTAIGEAAFKQCANLTSVTFAAGISRVRPSCPDNNSLFLYHSTSIG